MNRVILPVSRWTELKVNVKRSMRREWRIGHEVKGGYSPVSIDTGYCLDRPEVGTEPRKTILEIERLMFG